VDQAILSLLAEKHAIRRWPDPSQWGEPHRLRGSGFDAYPTIFDHHRYRTMTIAQQLHMTLGIWRQRYLPRTFQRTGGSPDRTDGHQGQP